MLSSLVSAGVQSSALIMRAALPAISIAAFTTSTRLLQPLVSNSTHQSHLTQPRRLLSYHYSPKDKAAEGKPFEFGRDHYNPKPWNTSPEKPYGMSGSYHGDTRKKSRIGVVRGEFLVLKNGYYQWWQQAKLLKSYVGALSTHPNFASGCVVPSDKDAHIALHDPFPLLTTVRDSRFLQQTFKDVLKGAGVSAAALYLPFGCVGLVAANRWLPNAMPSSFSESRHHLYSAIKQGEKPGWGWWAQKEDEPSTQNKLVSAVSGEGYDLIGLSNYDVVRQLPDEAVVALATAIINATPVNATLERLGTILDGEGEGASAMSRDRLSRLQELLPLALDVHSHAPYVSTRFLQREIGDAARLRLALVEFFEKIQIDDLRLRDERRRTTGLYALKEDFYGGRAEYGKALRYNPTQVQLSRYREALKTQVRGVGGMSLFERSVAELAATVDQRLGLSRPAVKAPLADANAHDAMKLLDTWLDASAQMPVAALYAGLQSRKEANYAWLM